MQGRRLSHVFSDLLAWKDSALPEQTPTKRRWPIMDVFSVLLDPVEDVTRIIAGCYSEIQCHTAAFCR